MPPRGFDLPTLGAVSRWICPQDHGAPHKRKIVSSSSSSSSIYFLGNLANEKIKQDKKNANKERIAKAKSEAEMWKIVADITNSKAKDDIKILENDKIITDGKEVANTLNNVILIVVES